MIMTICIKPMSYYKINVKHFLSFGSRRGVTIEVMTITASVYTMLRNIYNMQQAAISSKIKNLEL